MSQFTTQTQSFDADLDLFHRLKIRRMELCEDRLSGDEHEAAEQLRAIQESGLGIDSIQAHVHSVFPDQMSPEPVDPAARLDCMRRSIDRFVAGLPEFVLNFVLISGCAPDHDLARAREQLVATAEALAQHAGERECRIAFEPLNPVMMNVDTFVYSWTEGVDLVEGVNHPDLGLVCDLWNVWQEPEILEAVHSVIDRVAVVHVSDWRDGGPRRLNDRLVPGEGVIPLGAWGRMLQDAHYSGPVLAELLSDRALDDSYLHRDLAEVVTQSRDAVCAAGIC